MSPSQKISSLNLELLWLVFAIPLSLWVGVAWDFFQEARGIQSFLGSANNIYFIACLPIVLLSLHKIIWPTLRRQKSGQFVLIGAGAVLAWMGVTNALNQNFDSVAAGLLPVLCMLNFAIGTLACVLARQARAASQGAVLQRALIASLVATGVGVTAAMIVHLTGDLPSFQPFLFVDGFANLRTLGETAAAGLLAGIVWFWKRPTIYAIAFVLMSAAVVAWSGTRAAWVAVAGALFLGALLWRHVGWKKLAATLALLAVGAVLSLPIPTPHGTYGLGRVAKLAQETTAVVEHGIGAGRIEAPSSGEADSNRVLLWSWGLDTIAKKPWTGYGMGAMGPLEKPKEANFKHLHNLPMDLAFGLGVPMGLALTLFLAFATLRAFWDARRDALVIFPLLAGTLLATSLFAGVFLFPITVVLIAIGLSGAPKTS